MRNYAAKDVDSYIAGANKQARPMLAELRTLVKSTVPEVEERISWGVPFYRYHGLLAGFSAFKNHVSFGLCFTLDKKDREVLEAKGYSTGIKTVQILYSQEVPTTEIKRMLKAQAKANEDKTGKK